MRDRTKASVWAILFVIVVGGGAWSYHILNRPAYHAELSKIKKLARGEHTVNTRELEDETQTITERQVAGRRTNMMELRDAAMPSAVRSRAIDTFQAEWKATVEGKTIYSPPRKIEAGSNSWQLRVAISGNPQSIIYAGGTVSSAMGKIVVANDGQGTENPGIAPRYLIVPKAPFLSLIARVHVPGRGYTPPFLFGNGMVLCGQYPGGAWMEFRVNEVAVASFHGDNSGSMTVAYAPVHSSACAQTPVGVSANAGN
ncbi:MAG: hypothetical protein Q8P83_04015 [bacterium]|nr:hypothetical protein [bacterium]